MWQISEMRSENLAELNQAVALLQAQKRVQFLTVARVAGFGGMALSSAALILGFSDYMLVLMSCGLVFGGTVALKQAKLHLAKLGDKE